MILLRLMEQQGLNKYKLSQKTGIAYSTISDLCTGKTSIKKSSVEVVYKIAKALNVNIEDLIRSEIDSRCDFDLYKSNVCHKLKRLGDKKFILDLLESREIDGYYDKEWYPECFYLLAMLDYLCRINNLPICAEYKEMRTFRIAEPIYPKSILVLSHYDKTVLQRAYDEAIPEFKKFNIIEKEVRDSV